MDFLNQRRAFLARTAGGFGSMALSTMLQPKLRSNEATQWFPPTGEPHFAPQADSVIWVFLNGGMSHLESFDPKPELDKHAGKTIAESPYQSVQDPKKLAQARVTVVNDANGQQRNKLYPTQVQFKKRGQSGIEVSDFFPHIGGVVDDLAIIRSMWTTDDNHGAQTQFHSGRHMLDGEFPTLGAWVHYGLGRLSDNLPQFISMGTREYWNKKDGHYLGPRHDAVPIRVDPANPLDFGKPERPLSAAEERLVFDLTANLDRHRSKAEPADASLSARLASYELAYRMQRALPIALDFSKETAETQKLYGLDRPETKTFAMQMLASRRLVERGVRFIQIQHGGGGAGSWDAHGDLKGNHTNNCRQIDQPLAGLITDLKRRGMLKRTLVVLATEFGRTPGSQGGTGRDHHIFGFTVVMAGGGLKGGLVHGTTDPIGFHAEENRHYVTDVHATILKQMGLDSRRLEIPDRKRLEIDHGKPITEIIA